MIKSAHNYPVSQLFDLEAGVIYTISRYQREYSWTKTQCEILFDNIHDNSPGYFLGSIICINQSNALKLNQDLAASSAWTVQNIEARTQKLVEQTMMIPFMMAVGTP